MKIKIITALVLSLALGSCTNSTLFRDECKDPNHPTLLAGIHLVPPDHKDIVLSGVLKGATGRQSKIFSDIPRTKEDELRQTQLAEKLYWDHVEAIKHYGGYKPPQDGPDQEKYDATYSYLFDCAAEFSPERWGYVLKEDDSKN